MHEPADETDPDENLAARIADAVLELARKPGRHRLAAMQMAGLAGERPTHGEIAKALGLSVREVRFIEMRALAFIAWNHPHLREDLRPAFPPLNESEPTRNNESN